VTGFQWSKRSSEKLSKVDGRLVSVVNLALARSPFDLTIIEGLRSQSTQLAYFKAKKSKTLHSRHLASGITGLSNAIDIGVFENGRINWTNVNRYNQLAALMFGAADELRVLIRWGADWNQNGYITDEKFLDFVHYELPAPHNIQAAIDGVKRRANQRTPQ